MASMPKSCLRLIGLLPAIYTVRRVEKPAKACNSRWRLLMSACFCGRRRQSSPLATFACGGSAPRLCPDRTSIVRIVIVPLLIYCTVRHEPPPTVSGRYPKSWQLGLGCGFFRRFCMLPLFSPRSFLGGRLARSSVPVRTIGST